MNWDWFYFAAAATSAVAHVCLCAATFRTPNGVSWWAWRCKLVASAALGCLMAAQVLYTPAAFARFDPLLGAMAIALVLMAIPTWILVDRVGRH